MMIGGLVMLAMSAFAPIENVDGFDLADARPIMQEKSHRSARFLLPRIEEPAPPPKARLRVRGRTVKWRVPLGSF